LYDWAAAVGDPLLQSKVFISQAALAVAASREDNDSSRLAGLSLKVARDLPLPWRPRAHGIRALSVLFADEERARHEMAQGYAALEEPGAIAIDRWMLDLWEADLHLWRREYEAAVDVATRFPRSGVRYLLMDMNLYGCSLLASMLADDRAGVERQLSDAAAAERRAAFLASARRGELWLLSYEAIRAAALGYLGEVDRGRRELADAYALQEGRWMQGVDADFLGGFGWLCLSAGEPDRAEALLADTWANARSPNTLVLLMEALERSRGITDATSLTRTEDLVRRSMIRDIITSEGRTRGALDSEVARLRLT
jgi:hypothetical protein